MSIIRPYRDWQVLAALGEAEAVVLASPALRQVGQVDDQTLLLLTAQPRDEVGTLTVANKVQTTYIQLNL